MKLDISCVRDILLTVEKYEDALTPVTFHCHSHSNAYYEDFLANYTYDKIFYHVRYCVKAGLLSNISSSAETLICSMEPEGHSLLANTRTPSQWKHLNKILSFLGDASLNVITAASEGITMALLNKYLNEKLPKLI